MIEKIINDIQTFPDNFKKLTETDQARVVIKTAVVAATVGLTTGLVFGVGLAIISFTATALYVGTSTTARLTSLKRLNKLFRHESQKVLKQSQNILEDLGTSLERGFEDLLNSGSPSRQKMKQRHIEDLDTHHSRVASSVWDEFLFIMKL